MKKENITLLLNSCDPKLKKSIKEIYKLKSSVISFNWEKILISIEEFNNIKDIAQRQINGEDVTFDIGYRYFRNERLKLSKGVFVPQYDTEQIIDLVHNLKINEGKALEIGSGTGAISISLANETSLEVTSLDINEQATSLAKENDINGKVEFVNGDFFKYKPNIKYDLLISNPPYIDIEDKEVDEWVIENQPYEALYAQKNGLEFYISFFNRAEELLSSEAYIIVEIGYSQAYNVVELAKKISNKVEVIKDYSGLDRFIVIRYENNRTD